MVEDSKPTPLAKVGLAQAGFDATNTDPDYQVEETVGDLQGSLLPVPELHPTHVISIC